MKLRPMNESERAAFEGSRDTDEGLRPLITYPNEEVIVVVDDSGLTFVWWSEDINPLHNNIICSYDCARRIAIALRVEDLEFFTIVPESG